MSNKTSASSGMRGLQAVAHGHIVEELDSGSQLCGAAANIRGFPLPVGDGRGKPCSAANHVEHSPRRRLDVLPARAECLVGQTVQADEHLAALQPLVEVGHLET